MVLRLFGLFVLLWSTLFRSDDLRDYTESLSHHYSCLVFIITTHTHYLKHPVIVVVTPMIPLVMALELPVRRITPGISVTLTIAAVTLTLAAAPERW